MSWRVVWYSVIMAVVWTAAALLALRPAKQPFELTIGQEHIFIASMGDSEYRVIADEARIEGFCTVFIKDGERIAGVCGQHTWTQTREE